MTEWVGSVADSEIQAIEEAGFRGRYFAQRGINFAQAKFPESPKKVFLLPRNEGVMMFFALNFHF